jgi:hypothetical protein
MIAWSKHEAEPDAVPHVRRIVGLSAILVIGGLLSLPWPPMLCALASVLVALAPFAWPVFFRRGRAEGIQVAECYVWTIAAFALRGAAICTWREEIGLDDHSLALLGPSSLGLSAATVLVATVLSACLACLRTRRRGPSTDRPRAFVALLVLAAASPLLEWWVNRERPSVGLAWESMERVDVDDWSHHEWPHHDRSPCEGFRRVHLYGGIRCEYVVDEAQCLVAEPDWESRDEYWCPAIDVRRVPGSGTLLATRSRSRHVPGGGWERPGPAQVIDDGTLGAPATGAPPVWRAIAVAGLLFCALLAWRGRGQRSPMQGPYRTAAVAPPPAPGDGVALRHARLVLFAATIPLLVALGAGLTCPRQKSAVAAPPQSQCDAKGLSAMEVCREMARAGLVSNCEARGSAAATFDVVGASSVMKRATPGGMVLSGDAAISGPYGLRSVGIDVLGSTTFRSGSRRACITVNLRGEYAAKLPTGNTVAAIARLVQSL